MAVRLTKTFFLALIVFVAMALPVQARNPLVSEVRRAPSGEKYFFVFINGAPVSFVVSRPDRNDPKLLLSIPAGFVTPDDKAIGVCVYDGKIHNAVNRKLGGALKVVDGRFDVIDTRGGAALTPEYLADVAGKNGGLFQQFSIVKNRMPSTFKDKGKYLRRGIGKLKDGKEVVVESKGLITLQQLALDLIALGVKDFLYTDLGPWTEGWVRDPKTAKVIDIGNERKLTGKQVNWIIVSEPIEQSSSAEKPDSEASRP